jgi:hypothetical protein
MAIIDTTAHQLLPGDTILGLSQPLVVAGVDALASGWVIVDLTDSTSTAPMPAHAPVRVERRRRRRAS